MLYHLAIETTSRERLIITIESQDSLRFPMESLRTIKHTNLPLLAITNFIKDKASNVPSLPTPRDQHGSVFVSSHNLDATPPPSNLLGLGAGAGAWFMQDTTWSTTYSTHFSARRSSDF